MTPFLISLQALTLFFLYLHLYLYLRYKNSRVEKFDPQKSYAVILPACNEEAQIGTSIEALLQQKGVHISEIIVIVNNSTDRTHELVQKIAKKDKKISIIHIPGFTGKSKATLIGLKKATCDNVFLLDADTILSPYALKNLATYHEEKKSNFTIGIIQYKKQVNWESKVIEFERYFINNFLQTSRGALGVATIHGSFSLVNREVYLQLQEDKILQEDLLVTYKLIAKGEYIKTVNQIVAEEEDRQHFLLFIIQRSRWVTGNANLFFIFLKSLLSTKGILRKIMLLSYPFLWYFIYYFILLGYAVAIFHRELLISTLALHCSYWMIVFLSALSTRKKVISTYVWSIIHSLLFPVLICSATLVALFMSIFRVNKFGSIFFKRT